MKTLRADFPGFGLLWVLVVGLLTTSCSSQIPAPAVVPSPTPNRPVVQVVRSNTPPEKRVISVETIPQNNCGGTAAVSNELERSRTIARTVELGGSVSVNANGEAGIPGVGNVQVGAEIAATYGYSYGQQDTISRKLTVTAKEGSGVNHKIQQVEYWQIGEVIILITNKEVGRYAYQFRTDFGVELVETTPLVCSISVPTTVQTSTETPKSTTAPAATVKPEATTAPTTIPEPTSEGPSPTSSSSAIPSSDATWKGQYFRDTEFSNPPVYERNDPAILFDWGLANPAPGVPFDNFSVRWTRCSDFAERYYTFTGRADDRMQVYLDDMLILPWTRNAQQKFYVTAGRHCIKVEYAEGGGGAKVEFDLEENEQPTPFAGTDGWQGQYFRDTEFSNPPVYERKDAAVLFDWGLANPAPGVPFDNFSVRWTRCFNFAERYYTFTGQADDRMQVYLDDMLILPWTRNAQQKFYVTAGNHCLKVEYAEGGGEAKVEFDLEENEQPTPFAGTDGWKGLYFRDTEFSNPPVYERTDAAVLFDWGLANPAPGVPFDNFSVRWTRCFDFAERNYTFTGRADDRMQVYLDDMLILPWTRNAQQKVYVTAGSHCLKVEYAEGGGEAKVEFRFE